MFWEKFYNLCVENGTSPNKVAAELKISSGSVTGWKNGTMPRWSTLEKIADYFNVSVDYLVSDIAKANETKAAPPRPSAPTEADLKVALFGGDSEVTDEMWNEVKRFAEFVKQNQKKK